MALSAAAPVALTSIAQAAPATVWDRVAQCESGGRWHINTGNGYQGGLQFAPRTWTGHGGRQFAAGAHQASRAEQIVVAERVLASQGWGAWPTCSRKAGARGATPSALTTVPPSIDQPAGPSGGTSVPDGYRVASGETLGLIAARFAVEGGWQALATANGVPNPHRVQVGLVLT